MRILGCLSLAKNPYSLLRVFLMGKTHWADKLDWG
jgi:hypothetical protein